MKFRNAKDVIAYVLVGVGASIITGLLMLTILPAYLDNRIIGNDADGQRINYMAENMQTQDNAMPEATTPQIELQREGYETTNITAAAAKVLPSVVGISTAVVDSANMFNAERQERWSVGSGIIVSEDGYILTNQHVIGTNPDNIIVTLDNGKTLRARRLWSDATLDIAIIKMDGTGFTPAKLGDSNQINVGQTAVAIGNPLGLQFQRTVTAGIVSAINRTISVTTDGRENYMEGLIQTDASINPGNSGGPLINTAGEVVGINTIKVITAEGMGFAIPINICKPVITSFVREGRYRTPYMGLFAFDKVVAQYVDQEAELPAGVLVTQVDPHGPVYEAGVREGDVITHICTVEVNTMMQLREEMFECGVGSVCTLRLIRDGEVMEVYFELEERQDPGLITR